ncbi:hypothetical protein [Limnoglobus roseus]|uniref:Uncharacterized protein n=1 Tax=Limnoglobus roseus TaxID=2598579 RepID=A0A5C1AKV9_9BACT|nr:hypothetical protein [Limnoglobus roseus]QEL19560.1 hypothetical protein PX52LOC_06636 [Limnoglobus roseus]
MATILVRFDTKDKALTGSIDGKVLHDLTEVFLTRGSDSEFGCSLSSRTESEPDGMTRLVAAESVEGRPLVGVERQSVRFPEFVLAEARTKTEADIAQFFAAH